ncbi:probable cytochrome P450 6d5 [Culicoides brevitarsis]|uniref:probable cytochrome P450 6d5 n=1 Tax=Culicoides brevitarsis TaxID=469753 RepID=UPI00307B969D
MFQILTFFFYFFLLLAFSFYFYTKKVAFTYWTRRNVPQLAPTFPLGDLHSMMKQKLGLGAFWAKLYHETKSRPFIGFYALTKPALVVNDGNLMKNILARDAAMFPDRGTYSDDKRDPLSGGLFNQSGEKWRHMRTKLTPSFTSGKLKGMFQTMQDCGLRLKSFILTAAERNETLEMRDLMARFTTDVVASVAFGNQIDSINNPHETFREMGRKTIGLTFKNLFRLGSLLLAPNLLKITRMKSVDDDVEEFFTQLVQKNLEYREGNRVSRKDFLQLLIQLRNSGSIKLNDDWDTTVSQQKNLSLNEMAAQAFTFYVAGFETSSTTMSFCLYELAKNRAALEKVQREIDRVLNRYDAEWSYDALQEMNYLENCIDETLRKYPPLPILQRSCIQKYKIPDSGVTIEPGTLVILPIIGIQRDPLYFPEPMKFIPERFTDVKYAEVLKKAYYPFGEGPRACIGTRMGKLMTKIGLATILAKFDIQLGLQHEAEGELEISRNSILLAPEYGIFLKASVRDTTYFVRRASKAI